jgi:hypothetical protein
MYETTPGMEREMDVGAAAQYAAGGQPGQPPQAPELHGGRTARDRLTAYAEMRHLIELETAHDIEEMRKEIRFLAATYKLASQRLEDVEDPGAEHVVEECERRGVLINAELKAVEAQAEQCFGEGWMDDAASDGSS